MPRARADLLAAARALLASLTFALVLLAPRDARAWVEMHVARDDIRVTVDKDGGARVEHKVLLLVSGGPLKSFTIRGVDADASVEEGPYLVSEQGDKAGSTDDSIPLAVRRETSESGRTDIVLEIDGGRGVGRGRWVAVVRYRTNLVAQGLVKVEGTTARIDWIGPSWDDGLETTRMWLNVPTAPIEPKAIEPGDDEADAGRGTFLSTLSRRPGTDILELVRPYASKGERVVWSVRVDARAITQEGPASENGPPAPRPHEVDARQPLRLVSDARGTLLWLGAFALFVLVASLVAAHSVEVSRAAALRGQKPRPLVPLPGILRAALAAALFVAGIGLQLHQPSSLLGSLAVSACVPLVWHRTSSAKAKLRGPGAWLCIRVEEAFAAARPRPSGFFSATSLRGGLLLFALVLAFACASRVLAERSVYHAILIALDIIPLLSLFLAGRSAIFEPDPAVDPIPLFSDVVRRVQKKSPQPVRVIPRVRIPNGEPDADEIRVVFVPSRPTRGLKAVELAAVFGCGPGGWVTLPEVLLRFDEGSACDELVQGLEPFGRVQRGRRAEERVVSFCPKVPTATVTADLVLAVLERTTTATVTEPTDKPRPKARRAPARSRVAAAPSVEVDQTG